MRNRAFIAAAAIWIVLSVSAKAVRYAGQSGDLDAANLVAISEFLGEYGFGRQAGVENAAQHISVFGKAGCAAPLHVVMIGTGGETVPWLKSTYRDDLLFFVGGKDTPDLSLIGGFLAAAKGAALQIASGGRIKPIPRFALSPRPDSVSGPCGAPGTRAWRTFLAQEARS